MDGHVMILENCGKLIFKKQKKQNNLHYLYNVKKLQHHYVTFFSLKWQLPNIWWYSVPYFVVVVGEELHCICMYDSGVAPNFYIMML